jgi:hypothetical protein
LRYRKAGATILGEVAPHVLVMVRAREQVDLKQEKSRKPVRRSLEGAPS